jgi:HEAT repeat protein
MPALSRLIVAVVLLSGYLCTLPGKSEEPGKDKPKARPQPKKAEESLVVKEDADIVARDEQLLQKAKVGLFIAKYLTKRSGNDTDLIQLEKLVHQLGSNNLKEREDASRRIVALGMVALPALRAVRDGSDKEAVNVAKACREKIVREADSGLSLAAVRTMLRREQPKTFETLLRFLPYVGVEPTEETIWFGLDRLTERQGKVNLVLLDALKDAVPSRRALAACIIGHHGTAEQRAAVRNLLNDKEAVVRLRAAQGLLAAKDKAAIPVLVELLQELSVEISWQAEELLHWVAGEEAPETAVGAGKPTQRKRCHEGWSTWWKAHSATLDLTKLEKEFRRPLLLFGLTGERSATRRSIQRVWLCGCDGKPRWQLNTLGFPRTVHWLPGNRILLCESGKQTQISVRDLEGKVLWETQVGDSGVKHWQILPNGHVFLSTGSHDVEINPDGEIVFELNRERLGGDCQVRKLDDNRTIRTVSARWIVDLDAGSGLESHRSVSVRRIAFLTAML